MKYKLVILGAGGMAQEVYQIYRDLHKEDKVLGFLINTTLHKKYSLPKPLFYESDFLSTNSDICLVNGIGTPLRKKWITKLKKMHYSFGSAIHPSVIIGNKILLGDDVIINANSVLTQNISVGDHVIINVHVSIGHDSIIKNYVTISPGVHIGGRVEIGQGTFIGIGTAIIQNIRIGNNSVIGAGSVVIEDIPDNSLVYGNPAKIQKKLHYNDWQNLFKYD